MSDEEMDALRVLFGGARRAGGKVAVRCELFTSGETLLSFGQARALLADGDAAPGALRSRALRPGDRIAGPDPQPPPGSILEEVGDEWHSPSGWLIHHWQPAAPSVSGDDGDEPVWLGRHGEGTTWQQVLDDAAGHELYVVRWGPR